MRHFMGTSTFAEATVMPEIALAVVDPAASLESICTLACGATTGVGAALYTAKVEPGSTCAVFGAGPRRARHGRRLPARRRRADHRHRPLTGPPRDGARAGRDRHLIAGDDTVAQILEMTGGFGADYTFEATGLVAVMRQAVEAARMGWGLCTLAGVAGKGETLDVIPRFLITGRRIAGTSFGGAKGRDRVPELVRLYLEGQLDLDAFVSHRMPLDDVNHAFELMERQDGVRSVLTFSP